MRKKRMLNRRSFLKKAGTLAAGAVGFPYFVQSSALGKDGGVSASNRIAVGFVGLGDHGTEVNLRNFISHDDVQVVGLCDVNRGDRRYSASETGRSRQFHALRIHGPRRSQGPPKGRDAEPGRDHHDSHT